MEYSDQEMKLEKLLKSVAIVEAHLKDHQGELN